MSEEINNTAVEKATGKDWAAWFAFLEQQGGKQRDHKGLVAVLSDAGVSAWWCQTIAGTFEREFLGREKHEMPDGYQASASKTINAPLSKIYGAFDNGSADWLPGGTIEISTAHKNKTLRGAWTGNVGGRVDIYFTAKDASKTQVAVNHTKLVSSAACEKAKADWRAALTDLKVRLEEKD